MSTFSLRLDNEVIMVLINTLGNPLIYKHYTVQGVKNRSNNNKNNNNNNNINNNNINNNNNNNSNNNNNNDNNDNNK